jgi:hypothetical protein
MAGASGRRNVKTHNLSQNRKGCGTRTRFSSLRVLHPSLCEGLVHTVLRIPGPLLFAQENNLAGVVGIVGANVLAEQS